jgi:type II secretory ATPase GspE/PulE/Tfp pilus assembly ATPase PilB-like protein
MNENPFHKFILLVLYQAQNDGATELVINAAIGEKKPIQYKVDGNWYELASPPEEVLPGVLSELKQLANLSESATDGLIDVDFSGTRLRWRVQGAIGKNKVVLQPMEPGESLPA